MTEQEKLDKHINESMGMYISSMFNEASESIQDEIFALLEDDVGIKRGEELWREAYHATKMMLDTDECLSELDNKNKE